MLSACRNLEPSSLQKIPSGFADYFSLSVTLEIEEPTPAV
jgi:hypothetical protein